MVLSESLMQSIPLLHPILGPIISSMAQDIMPAPFQPKALEVIIGDLLGGTDPDSATSKRAAQEAKVVKFRAILATMGDDDEFAPHRAVFEAKLAVEEAAFAKSAKETPSPSHDLMAYRRAKADHDLRVQGIRDRQAAGAAKSQERRKFRGEHIQAIMKQLQFLSDGLAGMDKIVDDAHLARLAARQEHEAKVTTQLTEKITALELMPACSALAPSATPAVAPPLVVTPVANALPPAMPHGPASSAAGGAISNLDQLTAAGAQITAMTRCYEEAVNRLTTEFNTTHEDVNVAQLPHASLPPPEDVGVYGLLLNVFDEWAVNGACLPFDWQTLASKAPAGRAVHDVVRTLVGDVFWAKFCPQAQPQPDAVVPRQLVLLTHHALRFLKFQYDNVEAERAAKQQAQDTIEVVRNQVKRHRSA